MRGPGSNGGQATNPRAFSATPGGRSSLLKPLRHSPASASSLPRPQRAGSTSSSVLCHNAHPDALPIVEPDAVVEEPHNATPSYPSNYTGRGAPPVIMCISSSGARQQRGSSPTSTANPTPNNQNNSGNQSAAPVSARTLKLREERLKLQREMEQMQAQRRQLLANGADGAPGNSHAPQDVYRAAPDNSRGPQDVDRAVGNGRRPEDVDRVQGNGRGSENVGRGPEIVGRGPEDVNSSQYVHDMVNLSVELDHDNEEHQEEYNSGLDPAMPQQPAGVDPAAFVALQPSGAAGYDDDALPFPAPKPDLKAAARQLLASFNAAEYIGDRHSWMVMTAPETPVAGEECIVLFNRLQSETLKVRPRILLLYAFNAWGLETDDGQPFKADVVPAPVTHDFGSDWWWARIRVPENAFELNFVLADGDGLYENNGGQDFMFPVAEGVTMEEWAAQQAEIVRQKQEAIKAAERAKMEEEQKIMQAKLAEERKSVEQREREAQEALKKQDETKGKQRAEELARNIGNLQRNALVRMRKGGKVEDEKAPPVWCVTPEDPQAMGQLTVWYNRKASPLHWIKIGDDQAITLRYGVNSWKEPQVMQMKRATAPPPSSAAPSCPEDHEPEWWCADLELPLESVVVNFVVNFHEHYDNNGSKDYAIKISLPAGMEVGKWQDKVAELFRLQEFETRVAAEEAARAKELKRMEKKQKARDAIKVVERRKVRHVLFSEPESVLAGEEVTIWYNPNDTPLYGKNSIYLLCGFNSWNHPSPVGPLPMLPPDLLPTYDDNGNEIAPAVLRSGSPTHWKATFVVPHDAYKMDFVFSDVPGGEGTYDNRGGYDYHIPVEGSPAHEPTMYVVHIAVEMAPIAKVGGLGDVVTALGRAVKENGHQVEVIVPKYEFFSASPALWGKMQFETEYDWGGTRIAVSTAIVEDLRVWFIEPRNGFFQTQSVYGRYDDEVRFDFFCKAALEFLLRTARQPDILHCHDWSTAHVAKAYWEDYNPYGLWKPKVVFTIHNLNYGQKKLEEAANYCQKFTTVSPTYAFETGGTPIIAPHVHKFCGIRNGIDPELWDPENNVFLPAPITPETVVQGKAAAKAELRKRVNLTSWQDKFLVGVVSRLTPQKGVHLIKHTAWRTLDRGGQFVLLGSAPDPKIQAEFHELQQSMGGQDASFNFKYDEPLSHLIYAACDMIVVPSMFEPCGLTQMIAMRYGTVPIVRHTGGLRDTVFDVDTDKERAAWELAGSTDWQADGVDETNGFAFEGTDAMALDYALNRAIDAYYNDRAWFHGLQRRVMEQDWTWNRPAMDYIELYLSATKQP